MNKSIFLSGLPIPFPELGVSIRPPLVQELLAIGETDFYSALEYLILDVKKMDNIVSSDTSNFEVLLNIVVEQVQKGNLKIYYNIIQVLSLIFPDFEIYLTLDELSLISLGEKKEKISFNKDTFQIFQEILKEMFCLNNYKAGQDIQKYNPSGSRAKEIAEKFKKRHKTLDKINNQETSKDFLILSKYVSILSVGLQKNMSDLLKYNVFQLTDEFERFNLYTAFDLNIKARLAGATDIDEVENWTKDLY